MLLRANDREASRRDTLKPEKVTVARARDVLLDGEAKVLDELGRRHVRDRRTRRLASAQLKRKEAANQPRTVIQLVEQPRERKALARCVKKE